MDDLGDDYFLFWCFVGGEMKSWFGILVFVFACSTYTICYEHMGNGIFDDTTLCQEKKLVLGQVYYLGTW